MKVVCAALMVLALASIPFAAPALAQTVPVIGGGNSPPPPPPPPDEECTTVLPDGTALLSGPATFTNPYLLLARLQHWLAPGSTTSSGRPAVLPAQSVRFAGAGRPQAWVRRVTW